ncbi:chalcone-flavanone isomerase [Puccinia sorghi]|uniref:Chalcone-flavanone isomerase n=1 Tax=Puccinia sorghi TaxID=27349 RepID=A0A0L6UD89_9BASI|nr:chalcone-flavanone isomerase [Puccinia sorghi]
MRLYWTAPIAATLGVGTYYYINNQIQKKPTPTNKKLTIEQQLPTKIITLHQPKHHHLTDPATQHQVPTLLHINDSEPLRLIGLGLRTVSFLSIKVYLASFYADQPILRALRVVPGWDDHLTKDKLLSVSHTQPQNQIRGEALFRNLLAAPAHFAIQITPVRNTDFTHLRDGFCRALTARLKLASQNGTISEPELEKASLSINTFRSFFPSGVSVPQGKSMTLIRTASQALVVEYDGNKLGELHDPIIARELFLAYFADHDPISTKLKESVAEGFSSLYQDSS